MFFKKTFYVLQKLKRCNSKRNSMNIYRNISEINEFLHVQYNLKIIIYRWLILYEKILSL